MSMSAKFCLFVESSHVYVLLKIMIFYGQFRIFYNTPQNYINVGFMIARKKSNLLNILGLLNRSKYHDRVNYRLFKAKTK